ICPGVCGSADRYGGSDVAAVSSCSDLDSASDRIVRLVVDQDAVDHEARRQREAEIGALIEDRNALNGTAWALLEYRSQPGAGVIQDLNRVMAKRYRIPERRLPDG